MANEGHTFMCLPQFTEGISCNKGPHLFPSSNLNFVVTRFSSFDK